MDSSINTDSENQKDPLSDSSDLKHKRSSSKWNDDISLAGSAITELTEMGELLGGSTSGSKLPIVCCRCFLFVSQFKNFKSRLLIKLFIIQCANRVHGNLNPFHGLEKFASQHLQLVLFIKMNLFY